MNPTPVPWHACNKGKCSCKQIWGNDYPVAEVVSGKWGDNYPSLRLVGPSIGQMAEAYMEQIIYGEVSEELAEANAQFIVTAVNSHFELLEACEEMVTLLLNPSGISTGYLTQNEEIILEKAKLAIAKAKQ